MAVFYSNALRCSINGYRSMSMFPKHYAEPIKRKDMEEFNKSELTKFYHIPIKPALNSYSDTVFNDEIKGKMLNYITKNGNKNLARGLLSRTLEIIKRAQTERMHLSPDDKQKVNTNAEKILIDAVENSRPLLQLTSIKRGGVNYQVPVPITKKRSYFLSMKWLLDAAFEKDNKVGLPERLAWEILDAAHGQGRVIKRKDDLHKQCESNRAYAHYRWS
ncbi:28S ribosomal protein S7, mitochondrial [Drosophila guanche]|uniref:Blast:28S ribosomal protein S7, mitochondrial n=2 Tax=Drosophila guanche TaxID=7266 RepID=A0A3B0KD93_DROGU|nr:28S ribosomal protein S7, mitochondrial [Drosophila guanche]SPP81618.1 blast:28S ribosomal protein S7%2C mitochondrial [Drosophila guanche]